VVVKVVANTAPPVRPPVDDITPVDGVKLNKFAAVLEILAV
jgi:hypothetical protein